VSEQVYIVATPEYSYEGLEGVVGYTPNLIFRNYDDALVWAEANLREHLPEGNYDFEWKREDDNVAILNLNYREYKTRVYDGPGMMWTFGQSYWRPWLSVMPCDFKEHMHSSMTPTFDEQQDPFFKAINAKIQYSYAVKSHQTGEYEMAYDWIGGDTAAVTSELLKVLRTEGAVVLNEKNEFNLGPLHLRLGAFHESGVYHVHRI
jgi:hypothetical protein